MAGDSEKYTELLADQANVFARTQGIQSGLQPTIIRSRLRSGRWQRLERGVYAAFTGDPARDALLWAALLRAGPGAIFSHETAAELHGLLKQPSPLIHIAVPADRHPARWSKIPDVVIHRSTSLPRTRHPTLTPPRTRIEDTVLDLIEAATTFDEAYDFLFADLTFA